MLVLRGVQGTTRRWPPLGEGHRGLTLVGYVPPPPPPPLAVPPLSVDNRSGQYTLAAALANLAALVMVNPGLRSLISLMMSSCDVPELAKSHTFWPAVTARSGF